MNSEDPVGIIDQEDETENANGMVVSIFRFHYYNSCYLGCLLRPFDFSWRISKLCK